jgi:hypothetical protein
MKPPESISVGLTDITECNVQYAYIQQKSLSWYSLLSYVTVGQRC